MHCLKGFIVQLDEEHCVNEFGDISGVLYNVDTEEEVIEKLASYIEYMEEEVGNFKYHIINLETGQANLFTHTKELAEG
ncbi:MAG: hypothetical protein ACRCTZ_07965 [Sarcina sp.]